MGEDGDEDGDVAEKGDYRAHHAHFSTFTDPYPVENAEQDQDDKGNPECDTQPQEGSLGTNSGKYYAQVEYAREAADGGGEKVIDEDEHAAQRTEPGVEGSCRDGDDSSALREAIGDFNVFEGQQDKDDHG